MALYTATVRAVASWPAGGVHVGDAGRARSQLALDTGFYRIRWDRATSAEKDSLRAMAVAGDRLADLFLQ